eukprot:12254984-Karenia_brevis.AAC.1
MHIDSPNLSFGQHSPISPSPSVAARDDATLNQFIGEAPSHSPVEAVPVVGTEPGRGHPEHVIP